ncbi:MAG: type II toxin-antitoxin system HipA family toxin, partial [Deltaproteobacteria bacterium]|nr:type II toxin-antitoxin system HipA family toxin [Deltaproteobacteria bacterium]
MTETKLTVFIYLPGETSAVPAGIFTHESDSGIGSFAYGRKYQERQNALPVDPTALPLGLPPREVTTNKGLYGAFRDAAPDYWGRL